MPAARRVLHLRNALRPISISPFDFTAVVDNPLSELIENAAAWKAEVSRLTGLVVKDVYLSTDGPARGQKVLVFSRL